MTNSELNRDIKRLYKRFLNKRSGNTSNWTNKNWHEYEQNENELKAEFKRLFYYDN